MLPFALIVSSLLMPQDADRDFAKFVDDYFAARYAFNPSEGTARGFTSMTRRSRTFRPIGSTIVGECCAPCRVDWR